MIDILVVYGILQFVTISTGFFMYKKNSEQQEISNIYFIYIGHLHKDIVELKKTVKRIENITTENNENILKIENTIYVEKAEEPIVQVSVEEPVKEHIVQVSVEEPIKKEINVKKTGTIFNIGRITRKFIHS